MSSESTCPIVEIGKIGKHPNADSLSITQIMGGYPCIFKTGDYQPGDKAVYIPVDMIVPENDPKYEFLQGHRRIKAKKLRGIFSMGLLVPIPLELADRPVGSNVMEAMGIVKYEPPIELGIQGECERDPGFMPHYDLEPIRKYGAVLIDGEEVVATEKLHGTNARFCYHEGNLWVGSHNQIKKESDTNLYWAAAKKYNLSERLRAAPDLVLFGEIFGFVQDLRYGHTSPGQFDVRFFDVYNIERGVYEDYDNAVAILNKLGLTPVPVLYRGPWEGREAIEPLAEGQSTIPNANCIREGLVVRPIKERFDIKVGRVVLKLHGQQFLLRRN